jgi:hypothetical protein
MLEEQNAPCKTASRINALEWMPGSIAVCGSGAGDRAALGSSWPFRFCKEKMLWLKRVLRISNAGVSPEILIILFPNRACADWLTAIPDSPMARGLSLRRSGNSGMAE